MDEPVATVEHGVPLVLPKWVHSLWVQDEDGQGQEPSQTGGFTFRPREGQARPTPTEGSGPGGLPGPRIKLEDTEDPEGPSPRQEARLPLGYIIAPLWISTPPHQKTWEERRRWRGQGAQPVVVSATVHHQGGRSHLTQGKRSAEERPRLPLNQPGGSFTPKAPHAPHVPYGNPLAYKRRTKARRRGRTSEDEAPAEPEQD